MAQKQSKARKAAEWAKARLHRERERQRLRSPGPPTSRSGTSPSRSLYLSEGSDSEKSSDSQLVLVDGLTTIQSALNSEGYQRKATNRIRQARLMTDLTWARQGLKGNQVDSFYEKKEKQDIQSSERAMVSVLHCVPTRASAAVLCVPSTQPSLSVLRASFGDREQCLARGTACC